MRSAIWGRIILSAVVYLMGLFSAIGGLVGGVLGGFGIHKAGSGIDRAARSLAADTGRTMAEIREDVRQIKEHLIREVWPRVNETLADVQELIKDTQTFVVTGTFAVKILALLLLVIILYFLKKQVNSVHWQRNAVYNTSRKTFVRSSRALVLSLEDIFFQFIFWICLVMSSFLGIHLLQEMFHIAKVQSFWPANVPFMIIIPSFATTVIIAQYLSDIVQAIVSAALLLVYVLFGLPLLMTFKPISAGFNYAQTSALLCVAVLITGPALYFTIAAFPMQYLYELFQLKLPLVEFLMLAYLVFFVTAIAINIMGEVLLKTFIRPLWSCSVRRNQP